MPAVKTISMSLAAESLTTYASNVTGVAFTLSANAASDLLAHRVTIRNDSATDHSGKTVTLVGTDADGQAQTEAVVGPGNAATVTSTKYFKTLTSATPSATIGADTFDIGAADEVASRTIMLNRHAGFGAMTQVDLTGSMNYKWQVTLTPRASYSGQEGFRWITTTNANLDGETADSLGDIEPQVVAARLILNSYTSTPSLVAYISEEQRLGGG